MAINQAGANAGLKSRSADTSAQALFAAGFTASSAAATPGNDIITGTIFADFLAGAGGNDQISGLGGGDSLYGETGDDILFGGDDGDWLVGGAGNDRLEGEAGDDRGLGDSGLDQLNGGAGADILLGLADADTIDGGTEDDRLYGDLGNDAIAGGDGNDQAFGWTGNDILTGGLGNDRLAGEDGDDNVGGGEGDDILFGDRDTAPLAHSGQEMIDLNQARIGAGDFAIIYQGSSYNFTGLRDSDHDLIIINPAKTSQPGTPTSEVPWSPGDIAGIEAAGKQLIGYLSLSKINDFSGHWSGTWTTNQLASGDPKPGAPAFIRADDPKEPNTRLIDYWAAGWKELLVDRIETMVAQGFSGIFFDDVVDYFIRRGPEVTTAAQAAVYMRDLIIELAAVARAEAGSADFKIIVNGAPFILSDAGSSEAQANAYYAAIDAILVENYFSRFDKIAIDKAAEFGDHGVALLSVDTGIATEGYRILVERMAVDRGFLPETTFDTLYATNTSRFAANFGDTPLPGSDTLDGGPGNDQLFAGAGVDTLIGGAGDDLLYFGASFTGADVANGGGDRDVVVLQGNYALTLSAANFVAIESLSLQSGARTTWGDVANNFYDYNLTMADANTPAGTQLIVNAQSLRVGEDFTFNGAAETNGSFLVYGGHGVDLLTGGAGADIFFFEGERWGPSDRVNGGAGSDALIISAGSGVNHIAFGTGSLTNIEAISLNARYATDPTQKPSYDLVLANGNVAAGGTLIVNGSSIADSNQFVGIDGRAVTGGNLILFGGAGHDTLMGGGGADQILGGRGSDSLTGGGGADVFRYDSTAESNAGANDLIGDFAAGLDKVDLSRIDANTQIAGDQAFSWIGSSAFTGSAGQLRVYQSGGYQWIAGDTDGDGAADLLIAFQAGTAPLGAGDFLP
jgi:uncharacterized protein (TIGR01370 family)